MRKTILIYLCIAATLFIPTSFAAIDVRLQGSVYTEISSRPGDQFRAGNRIKLFSELEYPGATDLKLRVWGLNQKADLFNRFDKPFSLKLDNLLDWVELNIKGNLFPQGPEVELSFGNLVLDYTPYAIMIKDEAFAEYVSDNFGYRGILLNNMELPNNWAASSFILWGFGDDPLKNMVGGKVERKIADSDIKGFYLNYNYRSQNAEENILHAFQSDLKLEQEVICEDVFGVLIGQTVANLGTFHLILINQEQEKFVRNGDSVERNLGQYLLKNLEWKYNLGESNFLVIGYRDFPPGFDPLLRDRTPEFHPITGKYLGFNPIDKNRDRIGYYTSLDVYEGNTFIEATISNQVDHQENPNRFRSVEFSLTSTLGSWLLDIYSGLKEQRYYLNTMNPDLIYNGFDRVSLSRPYQIGKIKFVPGWEWRNQQEQGVVHRRNTMFFQFKKEDFLTMEVGLRKGDQTGPYFGLSYKAPNGILFRYRVSTIKWIDDGKEKYDSDYRYVEPDNIMQLSFNVDF